MRIRLVAVWRRLAAIANAAALATLLLAATAPAVDADEQPELDLEGTWYVLIHYKDADAAHPDRDHWDDRLWVFERKGSRLHWTEYPIVVFQDREGRFERSDHGQSRVLHAWEPNAGQRAQIKGGLEFNTRGSKTKTMRRRKDGNWQSSGAKQVMSASVVGYHETWMVEGLPDAPIFRRDDVLGSERAESMSGRTAYVTEKISSSGSRLSGNYARDESRRGTFRMMRSGDAQSVGNKRTQQERMRDALQADGERQGLTPSAEDE